MSAKRTRLGFVSYSNPNDKKASSGTVYMIAKSLLRMGVDLEWIPVKTSFLNKLYRKACGLLNLVSSKKISSTHSIWGAKLFSASVDWKKADKCDILFFPFSSSALFNMKSQKPSIYLSDASFKIMVGFYMNNLSNKSIAEGNIVEQRAMDASSRIIMSSDWAANSAITDYMQPQEKVSVIEFGPNIDDESVKPKRFFYNNTLYLLFLGVDWIRKGGAKAVEAAIWLNHNGINTKLRIVGISELDDKYKDLPMVEYFGFLNKNKPDEYQKLVEIIDQSHALILPTMAECSAIAFCEASYFGLPVFSHITGGVRNYISDGRNGYLLPLDSTGEDFGMIIKECLESGELERMSRTCVDVYKEKLNWGVWQEKVERIINELI